MAGDSEILGSWERDRRAEALDRALRAGVSGYAVVSLARAFYDFHVGRSDQTPKEAVLAALERAGVK